jgi:DNA repair exonuclease SbcCD ATPase subunit
MVDNNKRKFFRRSYEFIAGLLAVAAGVIIYEEFVRVPSVKEKYKSEMNKLTEEYNSTIENYDNLNKKYEEIAKRIDNINELQKESANIIDNYRENIEELISKLEETINKYSKVVGEEYLKFDRSFVEILKENKNIPADYLKIVKYFPLIKRVSFEPKIVSEGIYDLIVNTEVASLSPLKEGEVTLKRKDKDEVKSIKIYPLGLDEESFSVKFERIEKGLYTLEVWVKDSEGNENKREIEIKLDGIYGG